MLLAITFAMSVMKSLYTDHIPPKRFDHWPSVPVLVLDVPIEIVYRACGGTYWANPKAAGVFAGCTILSRYLRGIMDIVPMLSLREQERVVAFEDTMIDSTKSVEDSIKGCVILVSALGGSQRVTKVEQYRHYRHELGHCNGWGAGHEL